MPFMLRHPLEGIRCQAMDENCKNHHCFFISHILKFYMLTVYALTSLMCCLYPCSGEYALAEYSEVKAVTIKLSETLWQELRESSDLYFPSQKATTKFSTTPTLPPFSSVMLMLTLALDQYISWSIQNTRALKESQSVHLFY